MQKERNINLDLIRTVAVISVISVHFFLNSGFYSLPLLGKTMYISTVFRTLFMICVPLFLLLTGYLMNKKELSKKYYGGIKKYQWVTLPLAIHGVVIKKDGTKVNIVIGEKENPYSYEHELKVQRTLYRITGEN